MPLQSTRSQQMLQGFAGVRGTQHSRLSRYRFAKPDCEVVVMEMVGSGYRVRKRCTRLQRELGSSDIVYNAATNTGIGASLAEAQS